ncbi:gas vesicle protein GvpO [Actinomadura hibisca]|uniref:gas vesicle protein GvpO n=1 Tax=Actinomadura hibisca TaxID=68565 RepID=UPI000836B178|nr:gas vesicle protein [Actinomadura hibisca]
MLTASDAAKRAVHHVTEMTGKEAQSVIGVERTDDGWRITVEVVETRRIPDSADILAVYQTEVDGEGELVSYRRTQRYPRGRVERG